MADVVSVQSCKWFGGVLVSWQKPVAVLVGALMLLGLSGCGEGDGVSASAQGSFPLPRAMNLRELPVGTTAKARIDELDREIPLQVSSSGASGYFEDIPPGDYTVEVIFESPSFGLVLARAEQSISFGETSQSVSFSQDDYEYPDEDGDKYSNLVEISVANDPLDKDNLPVPKRVFLTSTTGTGNLYLWDEVVSATGTTFTSGREAADYVCQTRANAAGLTGEYRAWLSTDDEDAYCHIAGLGGRRGSNQCDASSQDLGPYIRPDGFPVGKSLDALLDDGEMFAAISVDEHGSDLAGRFLFAWTGSNRNGEYEGDRWGACEAWDSQAGDVTGAYSEVDLTSFMWSGSWGFSCDNQARLMCFQVDEADTVLPRFQDWDAKKVFVTSTTGNGNLASWDEAEGENGLAGGDKVCQTLALRAGLENPDKFKAWLTVSVEDAETSLGRLSSNGPWARPDGVVVAQNKEELASGLLRASISQTETGEYVNSGAWTGSYPHGDCDDCGSPQQWSCEGWSSDSSSFSGKHGLSSATYEYWSDIDSVWANTCNEPNRLYCFEDE